MDGTVGKVVDSSILRPAVTEAMQFGEICI